MSNVLKSDMTLWSDGERTLVPAPSLTMVGTDTVDASLPSTVALASQASMRDTEAACKALLAQAEAEVERMLALAQAESVRICAVAQANGHRAGFADGMAAARLTSEAARAEQISRVEEMMAQLPLERKRLIAAFGEQLALVATEATRLIIHRELRLAPADIAAIVDELLQFVLDSAQVEIRVNPDDLTAATAAQAHWQGAKLGDWQVAVLPDLTVAAGGAEIRTNSGRGDATIACKLSLLQETLTAVFENLVHAHFPTGGDG